MKFLLALFFAPLFLHSSTSQAEPFSISRHKAHLPHTTLSYMAIAGKIPVARSNKKIMADLFFVSYHLEGLQTNRPITFVFPGGPGGAGTLEAICSFGPVRKLTVDEGGSLTPPYTLIDNPETLLDVTDLVYVDPVECGLSRCREESDPEELFGVEVDVEILAQFIHNYIAYFKKWDCPKFLMGNSYGTLRCSGLAKELRNTYDLYIHGMFLEGCALEFSTLFSQRDQPMPDWLLIPTLAATAWYHGKGKSEKTLEEVTQEARLFALRHYAPLAICPSCFDAAEKEQLFQQFADLIGLPLKTVQRYQGRINENIFAAEFFAPERKVVGGLDSRYAGEFAEINPHEARDPSYRDVGGTVAAFSHYLHTSLRYDTSFERYREFTPEVFLNWDWHTHDAFIPSFLQRVRECMIDNPQLKIFVASGYYDCRTPFAATEYCFDQLGLPPPYKNNISLHYYEAGHGATFDLPSLKKMRKDMAYMYNSVLK